MTEKTDDEVPSCGNCFFSEKAELQPVAVVGDKGETALLCRRYPPFVIQVVTAMGQTAIGGASPPVQPDGWCGEHEPTQAPLIEH